MTFVGATTAIIDAQDETEILNPLSLLMHSAITMERYSGGGEAITILAAICNNQLEKLGREGWYCLDDHSKRGK